MLKINNLNLYYGASQALRDVSLAAEKGRVTCLLGRNGVGKTSMLSAIAGHQGIASGEILWEDKPIHAMAPHERARAGIAYVPQGRELPVDRAGKPEDRLQLPAAEPALRRQ